MFRELAPLLKSTKGVIVVSIARLSDTHLRAHFYTHADNDDDRPTLTPLCLEGTPDELDGTLDFDPVSEVRPTVNEQLKAAGEQAKKDAADKAVEEQAAKDKAAKETEERAKKTAKKAAKEKEKPAAPAPVTAAATAPEDAAAKLRREIAELETANAPAAPPPAPVKTEQELEIERLQARLAALKGTK